MISLISKWQLKNGCDEDLKHALDKLAKEVYEHEADTLRYEINLSALFPLNTQNEPAQPPVASIPLAEQQQVIFVEHYKNAKAFAEHMNGPVFTKFRNKYLCHFYEDPSQAGWPATDTIFLEYEAGFDRKI